MRTLKQVRIITKKDHKYYLKDFTDEPMRFQEYVNFEIGQLFDNNHTVDSIDFIKRKQLLLFIQ